MAWGRTSKLLRPCDSSRFRPSLLELRCTLSPSSSICSIVEENEGLRDDGMLSASRPEKVSEPLKEEALLSRRAIASSKCPDGSFPRLSCASYDALRQLFAQ